MTAGSITSKGLRWGIAGLFVLAASVFIVRDAIVARNGEESPEARRLWPSNPDVLSSKIMAEVGQAAARRGDPSPATMAEVKQLAIAQPLSPVPFLVHGALAVRKGDYARAELLLLEARQRAPRSSAARYMLADLYLRTGRALPALGEIAVLNRFLPGAATQLAPALAAYATNPGGLQQLKAIIASYPELEPPLMTQLGSQPGTTPLILNLTSSPSPKRVPGDWQRLTVNGMLAQGDYAAAYTVWSRFAGVDEPPTTIFNPQFEDVPAPPPFNWEFAPTKAGIAEPKSNHLDVLYYGREDAGFATQVLLLAPGRYRLSMGLTAREGDPQALAWTVTCVTASEHPLFELPLKGVQPTGEFVIPPNCPAQRLQLIARASESAERADLSIGGLQLTRL